MAKIHVKISHKLTPEEALNRIKRLLSELKEQYSEIIQNLEEKWNDSIGTFSFTVMDYCVSGTLTVKSSRILLVSKRIPISLALQKGEIEKKIREKAMDILS